MVKKGFYLGLIVAAALLYFYPFSTDSSLYRIQSSLKSIGKSEADYREELLSKQEELAAYEKMIEDIAIDFENAAANAPVCSKTGRQIEIKMTQDPRPELRRKCEGLRLEIQRIEEELSD